MAEQIRSAIPSLYSRLFDEVDARVEPTLDKDYERLVTVMTDDSKQVDVSEVSGSGMWTFTAEGAATEQQELVQGYNKTFLHDKIGTKIELSLEAAEDDEQAIVNFITDYETIKRGGYARINQSVADLLTGGFSVAGADGQFQFSNSHPTSSADATALDNLLDGALSHDNLELAEKQISANYYGEDGLIIKEYGTRQLIFPPALRGQVMRILGSREIPEQMNRGLNRFGPDANQSKFNISLKYDPFEYAYLQSAQGGNGSDTAWFIRMPNQKMARLYMRKKLYFDKWMEHDPEAVICKGAGRFSVGFTNWREYFGSTGA